MSKTVKPSVRRHISRDVFTFKAVGYPLIFLFALVCLIPFLIVIGSSLTSENYIIRNGYSIIPKELSLESYKTIFQSPMAILRAYGVTIFVTLVGTALSVFLNTMAGYVLQRKDFEWRNRLSFFYFFTTLFSGGLMPWYILCVKYLGLKDSIWAMILPGIVSVWNILLVKGFMAGIPFEMTEAAKIDGCSRWKAYSRIYLPLSKPILATLAVLKASQTWNDYIWPLIMISKDNMRTVQVALVNTFVTEVSTNWNLLMAGTTIVMLPLVILFLFTQKYFVEGVVSSGIKG